jgi:hypothetical protein
MVMEQITHKYYGTEYGITIDGGHWFLDCSNGKFAGNLPLVKKEVNEAIKMWKKAEEQRKINAPKCKVCKKDPSEISEYKYNPDDMDPIDWVLQNERLTPDGNFYCTSCYIKAGMPLW